MPYGTSHWASFAVGAVAAAALVVLGRRLRGRPEAQARFSRGFAIVVVVVQAPLRIHLLLPEQFVLQVSLPLQLCDLALVVAVWALWTRHRWACAATYFWGLTLVPQAMLTPALNAPDFPAVRFVDFWTQHLLTTCAAIYLTWGAGIRPDWAGWRRTIAISLAWAVVIFPFNAAVGTNYGFLNHKPDNPSALDLLGPWPWYLLVEILVIAAAWALITWPWTRTPLRSSPAPPPAPAPQAGR